MMGKPGKRVHRNKSRGLALGKLGYVAEHKYLDIHKPKKNFAKT